jgi:carbamoyltransferase
MHILGINVSHHTSTCLINDGDIIYYIEEERLSRKKGHTISKDSNVNEIINGVKKVKNYTHLIDYVIISSFRTFDGIVEDLIIKNLNEWFLANNIKVEKIVYFPEEHHLFHASNAFYSSGFEEAACLIIDGAGSFIKKNKNNQPFREIESIYKMSYEDGIQPIFKHYSTRGEGCYNEFEIEKNNFIKVFSDSISCGDLFSKASVCFGMGHKDQAGKIMGMSLYGNSEKYCNWYSYIDNVSITNNNIIIPEFCKQYTRFEEKSNLASQIQKETKSHTMHLIDKSLSMTNSKSIVLSGGYFLNCVNNYEYIKQFPNVRFYIDPISHDGGTSIGAAKYLWYDISSSKKIQPIKTLYLGI